MINTVRILVVVGLIGIAFLIVVTTICMLMLYALHVKVDRCNSAMRAILKELNIRRTKSNNNK